MVIRGQGGGGRGNDGCEDMRVYLEIFVYVCERVCMCRCLDVGVCWCVGV